ncbi:restriction endonuclease subunit S [Devosia faecipullorum]|uniref:restriction endonuclease subunit S n=1 Tax=Devosia faecipullorum TaxID=2755039 RepID=UPI00187B89FB|nr:restriction endonuclease subunit S [Devosia faecipullorum]MBE7734416.1 restriction endonuclease subunit S [Devosia faecipullorum]
MSELPLGWAETTIGAVCDLVNGKAFKPSDWSDTGLPIVRIQNLNRPDAKFNHYAGHVEERFLIEGGDLLFAWSGTPGTSFGAHIWDGPKAVLNQHIFNVRLDTETLDRAFFRYAINQTLDEQIAKAHGGVGLRHVTKGKFEETAIALPPLPEQRRIVTKIDSLTGKSKRARDHLDHVPRLVEKYKQAVLAAAFRGDLTREWRRDQPSFIGVNARPMTQIKQKYTDVGGFHPPYEVPAGWRWYRLPQLGDLDRGKSRHRPRNDERLFGGPYPFVQTGEVRQADRFLGTFEQTYSDFGLAQSKLWPAGTVCITIAANIAETAILGIDACFPDSVVGFLPDAERVEASYVEFFLRTARSELQAFAPATAQKNINLDTLAMVRIPTAPLLEQMEIVSRIERAFFWIDRLASEATNARKSIDRLDQAVLAKAFRGELVPQNPEDEPAGVLLERIRAERSATPRAKVGRKARV